MKKFKFNVAKPQKLNSHLPQAESEEVDKIEKSKNPNSSKIDKSKKVEFHSLVKPLKLHQAMVMPKLVNHPQASCSHLTITEKIQTQNSQKKREKVDVIVVKRKNESLAPLDKSKKFKIVEF